MAIRTVTFYSELTPEERAVMIGAAQQALDTDKYDPHDRPTQSMLNLFPGDTRERLQALQKPHILLLINDITYLMKEAAQHILEFNECNDDEEITPAEQVSMVGC